MKRLVALCLLSALITAALTAFVPVSAQGGPGEAIMDAVFADLSQRVGKTVSWRGGLMGRWEFEELIINDDNLGCPGPGQAAPGQTRAWKIVITLEGIGTYDYRTTKDGGIILLCSGTGIGAPTPVTAPTEPLVVPTPVQPAVSTTPTTYQGPVIAYLGYDGNVHLTSLGINPGPTRLTGDAQGGREADVYWNAAKRYDHLLWSPDGARLIFGADQTLYMVISGQGPVPIATNAYTIFPGAWSPEGREVAYAVFTNQPAPGAEPTDMLIQVRAVPVSGGQARAVGSFAWGVGCGGGGWGPAVANYFAEAGYGGNNQVLIWTAQGFLHTTNCTGVGLALTSFAGQRLWEQPNLSRIAVSPDTTRAVALQVDPQTAIGTAMFLVDLPTGAVTPLQTQPNPDQAAWSGDGASLIYSTRSLSQTVPAAPNPVLPEWLSEAQSYSVMLWSVPVGGGQSTQVFSGEGFAIGQIASSPTTSVVAFSLIESEVAMFQRAGAGASQAEVLAAAPHMKLGVAALTPGSAGYPYFFDGNGGQPAISRAAEFTAIPAAVAPRGPTGTAGENPLGLVIGGRAVITPGGNVNLRASPRLDPNNVLGILRPGDYVVILSGPVFAADLRWWEVRRESDGTVGWVVDQFVGADGKVEDNLQPVQ